MGKGEIYGRTNSSRPDNSLKRESQHVPSTFKPLTIVDEITEDLIFKFYYRSLAEGQDKGHRGAGAMCVKGVCPGTHLESPLPCWIGSHPTLQNFALPW